MLTAVERKWRFPTSGDQRVLKLRGDAQQIFVNGEFSGGSSGFWDYTIYVNQYMVVRPEGHYTKHIYVNSQRIASKIGNPEDYAGGDPTAQGQGNSVGRKVKMEEVVEENFTELFGSIPEIEPAADESLGMSEGGSGGEPNQYWFTSDHPVSLPLDKYRKVAVDFCSDQGARKEYSLSYTTDEQRRYEQKDQDLVCLNVVVMTLRSSAFVTDASGVAIQHLEYMAFGEVFVDQRRTGFGTPYKFNAKELDCESGYYYYSARYYDPRMARFLSVDPLASDFPSWIPYHYVHNNPLRYTDPTGMSADDIIIRGSDGNTFNWTAGSTYGGDDKFIQQSVEALNALGADANTANFSFKGKNASGVNFEGNAVLDYASGGAKDHQDVFIEHSDNNPAAPGESQHITGTVYWDPSRGIAEEGFNGAEGSGAFPSMGVLVHEMGHAALYNEFGGADWQDRQHIFANEEQMIIDRLEKPAMQSLGFGYRTGHNTFSSRSDLLQNGFQGSQAIGRPFRGSYYIPSLTPTKLKK